MSLMETTWLHTFSDGPTSKLTLCRDRFAATCCPHEHRNTSTPMHTQTNTHAYTLESVAVESEILCCSVTLKSHTGCNGGKKALNAWKKMKLPLFQWSRKNSSEKCQQPIAAGFCCRGRHGLWFPHVSFLSHYASSFHPIKHKYGLRSTTQGASWCSFFWEKQTEEGGRQRVETDGWRQSNGLMWLCVCVSVCVCPRFVASL